MDPRKGFPFLKKGEELVNIYEVWDFIRKNDTDGEWTKISDSVMGLYTAQLITSPFVLQILADIVHRMILSSSPYAQEAKRQQQVSQGL